MRIKKDTPLFILIYFTQSSPIFLDFVFLFGASSYLKMVRLTPLILLTVSSVVTGHYHAGPLVDGCPQPCRSLGPNPSNWTHLHDTGDLTLCERPLLFDLNIKNDLALAQTIRSCAVEDTDMDFSEISRLRSKDGSDSNTALGSEDSDQEDTDAVEEAIRSDPTCGATGTQIKVGLRTGPRSILDAGEEAAAAANLLAKYIANSASCGRNLLFAKSGSAIVAAFTGSEVQKASFEDLSEVFGCVYPSLNRLTLEICANRRNY